MLGGWIEEAWSVMVDYVVTLVNDFHPLHGMTSSLASLVRISHLHGSTKV